MGSTPLLAGFKSLRDEGLDASKSLHNKSLNAARVPMIKECMRQPCPSSLTKQGSPMDSTLLLAGTYVTALMTLIRTTESRTLTILGTCYVSEERSWRQRALRPLRGLPPITWHKIMRRPAPGDNTRLRLLGKTNARLNNTRLAEKMYKSSPMTLARNRTPSEWLSTSIWQGINDRRSNVTLRGKLEVYAGH
eukprot:486897-Pelagomonas_calceolata.AAC.1